MRLPRGVEIGVCSIAFSFWATGGSVLGGGRRRQWVRWGRSWTVAHQRRIPHPGPRFQPPEKNRGMNSHSIVHFNSKKSVGVLHFWLNLISILNAYFISWAKNGTMNIQFLYVSSFFGSSR